jgi:hypothetical protein
MSASHIPVALQRRVRDRAQERCEYCRLAQAGQEATFHVDHIHPRRAGGATLLDNLALACVSCSLRKGGNSEAHDPDTGHSVRLFHPRNDAWTEHFEMDDEFRIIGVSDTGRATVALLRMNRPLAVAIRKTTALLGLYR